MTKRRKRLLASVLILFAILILIGHQLLNYSNSEKQLFPGLYKAYHFRQSFGRDIDNEEILYYYCPEFITSDWHYEFIMICSPEFLDSLIDKHGLMEENSSKSSNGFHPRIQKILKKHNVTESQRISTYLIERGDRGVKVLYDHTNNICWYNNWKN